MNHINRPEVVLRTRDLCKHYIQKDSLFSSGKEIHAVRNANLEGC